MLQGALLAGAGSSEQVSGARELPSESTHSTRRDWVPLWQPPGPAWHVPQGPNIQAKAPQGCVLQDFSVEKEATGNPIKETAGRGSSES